MGALDAHPGITTSNIDEAAELKKYQDEMIQQSIDAGMTGDDLGYIKEDLRSPCTQEIAVFRAFAEIVEMADDQIVIIDTAPTGRWNAHRAATSPHRLNVCCRRRVSAKIIDIMSLTFACGYGKL